jgi:hypothetical protein
VTAFRIRAAGTGASDTSTGVTDTGRLRLAAQSRPTGQWVLAGVAITSLGGPLALAALYAPGIVAGASSSAGLAMVAAAVAFAIPVALAGVMIAGRAVTLAIIGVIAAGQLALAGVLAGLTTANVATPVSSFGASAPAGSLAIASGQTAPRFAARHGRRPGPARVLAVASVALAVYGLWTTIQTSSI